MAPTRDSRWRCFSTWMRLIAASITGTCLHLFPPHERTMVPHVRLSLFPVPDIDWSRQRSFTIFNYQTLTILYQAFSDSPAGCSPNNASILILLRGGMSASTHAAERVV